MAEPSVSASVDAVVTEADTALALGSGDVAVLGTPRVLALAEAATVEAARSLLKDGQTSVGARVELDHRAPTPVGATVTATAVLVDRSDRRLIFDVRVNQDSETVATARITRALVDKHRFQASTEVRG